MEWSRFFLGGVRGGYNSGFRGLQPLLDLQKQWSSPPQPFPPFLRKKEEEEEEKEERKGEEEKKKGKEKMSPPLIWWLASPLLSASI